MKFIATSDLHGDLPKIPECDAVLICGDISPVLIQRNMSFMTDWMTTVFNHWVNGLPCDKVFLIAGNHDFWMERATTDDWNQLSSYVNKKLIVLENEHYDYNGITIHGTPECKWISNAWAYMNDIEELVDKYNKIPNGVDILMTHEAPRIGGMNVCHELSPIREFGSIALTDAIANSKPKYALCGHIHSGEHNPQTINGTTYVNVSYKNENYSPAYSVFTFELYESIDEKYINAAKLFMRTIQYDNGIIDRYTDVVYPKEWVDKIAKVAKTFFVANPDRFTEEDIETIACGCSDDNKFVYGELIGYNDLIDTLNEYFENI